MTISTRRLLARVLTLAVAAAASFGSVGDFELATAYACPFCSAPSQTLRQEMTSMDVVVIAGLLPGQGVGAVINGQATFVVKEVVRGDSLVKPGDELVAPYFGQDQSDKNYLVMAVNSQGLLWSSPLTLTDTSSEYVRQLFKLPEDPSTRLQFFYGHLESNEPLLASDAYDEFALAPYEIVLSIRDTIARDQVWKWLSDATISPDRKRLYYTLLGIVATEADSQMLEKRLRSENIDDRAGLDALIACYLTVSGEKGLPLIDELFLSNKKASYADTYAAVMALRFHGTDGNTIPRPQVLASIRLMLDRPEFADLVIPDLARWEDWTQIEKLTELFKQANDDNNWVRMPVINYLRTCPLPEAKEKLAELEKLDPKAFQRAKVFFPIPQTDAAVKDNS